MNKKSLIIITCFSSIFLGTVALAQSWNSSHENRDRSYLIGNSQVQRSTINLFEEDLRDPHYLRINTSSDSLRGEVQLNNRILSNLNRRNIEIDLAPLLRRGKNIVEIYGENSSANSSITLEFRGPQTRITQRTSGNSDINQILLINVE